VHRAGHRVTLGALVALALIGACARPSRKPVPRDPKAWALATTALLAYYNRDRVDQLSPNVRSAANVTETRRILREWWRVDSRSDLLQSLEFLERGGHRLEFQKLGESLTAMTDGEYQAALSAERSQPYRVRLMKLTREHFRIHRGHSLVAWDYGRYIMLCRWGYMVGFLTENEAWQRIMPAARTIQGSFRSWAEFGEDYLVGREFWSHEEMDKNGQIYRDIETWLLKEPRSPWNQWPWGMELGSR
jgi:uncharacterized protein DUF1266